jgi:26S proteasome regulatory subunit N1
MILLRIAQGLIHLGKGTMTLNPFHSDRQLICPTAVGALLCTCLAFIDSEQSKIYFYFFYFYSSCSKW